MPQEQNTKPFVPNPYEARKNSLNVSLTLAQWRNQNCLQDSQMILIIHDGPCREEFLRLSSKVNGQPRDSDITILPVVFGVGQQLSRCDVHVYLDEVYIWENSQKITFSGKMNSPFHKLSMVEVRGEYAEVEKHGALHCFG